MKGILNVAPDRNTNPVHPLSFVKVCEIDYSPRQIHSLLFPFVIYHIHIEISGIPFIHVLYNENI